MSTKESRATTAAQEIERHFSHTRKYFCAGEFEIPVAGLPEPAPCPFCGVTNVMLDLARNEGRPTCMAECGCCGTRTAFAIADEESKIVSSYEVVMESARLWNERPAPRKKPAD